MFRFSICLLFVLSVGGNAFRLNFQHYSNDGNDEMEGERNERRHHYHHHRGIFNHHHQQFPDPPFGSPMGFPFMPAHCPHHQCHHPPPPHHGSHPNFPYPGAGKENSTLTAL